MKIMKLNKPQLFLLLSIVGVTLLAILWSIKVLPLYPFGGGYSPTPKSSPTSSSSATSSAKLLDNFIYLTTQKPGREVIVSKVKLTQNGFVIIHRVDQNNQPGKVVGKLYLTAGEHTNVRVTLDETISMGNELYAMLHEDDGDRIFEFQPGPDQPVKDSQGFIAMIRFAVK